MTAGTLTPFEQAVPVYRPKIRTFAKKVWKFIPGFEQQDLEGELLEVLWKCTLTYHPDNGANFNTLFWRSAKNRTITIERKAKAQKRSAEWVNLDPEDFVRVCDEILSEFSSEDYVIGFEAVGISTLVA
jgi:DNA-directed RNA polymerase specialized sigma24 family protein